MRRKLGRAGLHGAKPVQTGMELVQTGAGTRVHPVSERVGAGGTCVEADRGSPSNARLSMVDIGGRPACEWDEVEGSLCLPWRPSA